MQSRFGVTNVRSAQLRLEVQDRAEADNLVRGRIVNSAVDKLAVALDVVNTEPQVGRVLIANTAYADTTLSELTGSTALSAVAACLCAGIAILLLRIYNKHTEEEPIITEEVNED